MKHRSGTLVKRGKNFYCRWVIDGKPFVRSLVDAEGNPIRNERDALVAKTRLMAPFRCADSVESLQAISAKLEVAKAELSVAEDTINPPLAILHAWTEFEKSPARPDSGPATLKTYGIQWGCFTRWLSEKYPDIKLLKQITKDIAEEYAAHLADRGVTANTFNKHIRVCELVLRVVKGKAKLLDNPFSDIKRKRQTPQHHRELTTEELRTVCQAADGELRGLLALGLYLGARLGDAATMEWGSLDLKKGLVRYIPRKTARRSGRILTVPLHPALLAILSETPPLNRKGFVLPEMAKLYVEKGPYAVARIVQAHFIKCGLETMRDGKGVRKVVSAGFHSLRHSAVSLLREAGAPLSVTMAIVGHSSLAMHDTYTHAGEGALKQAVAALPFILGDAPAVKALPAVRVVNADNVRLLAEQLTQKNVKTIRAQLLALANKKEGIDDKPGASRQ